jgi:hypothetical protein
MRNNRAFYCITPCLPFRRPVQYINAHRQSFWGLFPAANLVIHLASWAILLLLISSLLVSCDSKGKSKTKTYALNTEQADTTTAPATPQAPPDTVQKLPYWKAVGQLIGALPIDSSSKLKTLTQSTYYQNYRQAFDKSWNTKRVQLLDSLHNWAGRNLANERKNPNQSIFYPFSGADFVTIHTLYPDAKRYVLFGLEPEGSIPNLEQMQPERVMGNLYNVQTSMDDILQYSFFKTIDMSSDFRRTDFKGTLPILLAFVSRTGNEVLNAYRIRIDNKGNVLHDSLAALPQNSDDAAVTGYMIKFRRSGDSLAAAPVQQLEYYSVNVHDPHLKRNPSFLAFLDQLAPTYTYVKSASYLMHKEFFSTIRQKVQEVSHTILQDDSGIPYRRYDPAIWDIQLFGSYMQPIPLFANYYQVDLQKQYNTPGVAKPIAFGIGYRFIKGTSNLLLARKKMK